MVETSNIELNNLMFKLHELPDKDKRQVLMLLFTYVIRIDGCNPLTLKPQSRLRVLKYFQLKPVLLNMNTTQGSMHYDNSLQLPKISAYLSPLLLVMQWRGALHFWGHCTWEPRERWIITSLPPLVVARLASAFTPHFNRYQLIITGTPKW